jgi:hypothetical protein
VKARSDADRGQPGRLRPDDLHARSQDKPEVIGDSAYGDAATRASLQDRGFTVTAKCPPARSAAGRFSLNWARLAALGARHNPADWTIQNT